MQKICLIVISIVSWNLAHHARAVLDAVPACAPAPPDSPTRCKEYQKPDNFRHFFKVNGTKLFIQLNTAPLTLLVECSNVGLLDVSALPSFAERQVFDSVYIVGCALGDAAVADVLRALNVGLERKLALEALRDPLRARHAAGGLRPAVLVLSSTRSPAPRVDEHFYTGLANLSELWTKGVTYDRPPSGLKKWSSIKAMVTRLPAEVVAELTDLSLVEPELRDVSGLAAAVRLRTLSLTSPAGSLPPLPALRSLELWGWATPGALAGFPALETLSVTQAAMREPPRRWLAGNAALQSLQLSFTWLRALPPDLLHRNPALLYLSIYNVSLSSDMLPDDLLKMNTNLTTLNLSHNVLTTVPSPKFFSRLEKLESLDLSYNRLRLPAPDYRLPTLPALRTLWLQRNPLGDACPDSGTADIVSSQPSWLQELRGLQSLNLARTGAVRLCRDWLLTMTDLTDLDLADNNITELTYDDLRPVRSQPDQLVIDLRHNDIQHVIYTQRDYERARTDSAVVSVKMNSMVRCDCDLYWFARALVDFPRHTALSGLRCRDSRALLSATVASLACAARCGARCRCRYVPARDGLVADCEDIDELRNRTEFQQVVELSLSGTALSTLPAATSLPPRLRVLDLSNNSIARAAAGVARPLLRQAGLRLRLARNPLDCRCGDRDLVDLVLDNKDRIIDFDDVLCADASAPGALQCGVAAGVAASLGVLGVLAGAAGLALALLAHPALRARVKTALRVVGVRLPGAAGADGREYRYDAFVSFAEADAAWVATALAPRLERAGRRLCLHYRDFVVGELIAVQIERSVRSARRTLLVVSEAFARSAWARAELDAALAARGEGAAAPLVLLRALPPPPALALAPALAEYLAAATYLRTDDPHFERRLLAAVPARAS